MTDYINQIRTFKTELDCNEFLKKIVFWEENPVHKVFLAANGRFLVHLVKEQPLTIKKKSR